ncbi:hypothetical protein LJ707_13205 [Mucilaginibacter sp. UR6-1]|uniref:hypothetical protein n=1 Tax=Mucilaginibacter sp. UR6-1 TaxID=1435643 RepID=UPI001E3FA979|nr:hypothetical protein [Mucilaginibacter sp. UR6-1]MCC8409889.1 hypothetical protein [Mucilaginibacter sp. UR6-1]
MDLKQIFSEILQVLGNNLANQFEFGLTTKIGTKCSSITAYYWYSSESGKNKEIYVNICDLYKLEIEGKQSGNYFYVNIYL